MLDRVTDLAMQAWDLLGGRHLARVDMIVDEDAGPMVLEYVTCPGFTPTSVFPVAVTAAGLTMSDAVRTIAEAAFEGSPPW